ncbi:MAG: hypothetical protein JNG84_01085, partial [Archangium sp.]|nr:hypothetical protein [Archangium sp.]
PFPVVAGHDAHRAVGLGRVLFGVVQQSGTLVVDPRGVITMVVRATVPTGAFPEDDVFKLLEARAPAGGVAHAR